jgi:hypothetical protein
MGNQNALKHGGFSKEASRRRVEMRELIEQARKLVEDFEDP